MSRWYWVGAFAAALVFVIAYLNPEDAEPPPLPPELREEPDLYMEETVITQFRADGNIRYRLACEQITRFEKDALTRLEKPVLDLHRQGEPPWNLRAEHGHMRQRPGADGLPEEQLYLRDNVVLRQRFDDGRFVTMTTSVLYVFPEREYAETDQPVTIDTASGRTKAVGFEGDLKRGWMKLSSAPTQRVHIIVLPHQFK